ncbi:endonuclease III [Candidatus Woesearchaeota archaeon]|nr:endonuclease III [Candidatus Woesearchaeota archaeon]
MIQEKTIKLVLSSMRKEYPLHMKPVVTEISLAGNPFKVLISTILSLRTKDSVTLQASLCLFKAADTPQKMLGLSSKEIEKLIYPVGFYPTKAKHILEICRILIETYHGKVPEDFEKVLALPGVGRKTATLTMLLGFGHDHYICVDSHVHIISNRLGWVKTKTPEETEQALYKVLPQKYWKEINEMMVSYGQNVCLSVSPLCSKCGINDYCPKIGVKYSR